MRRGFPSRILRCCLSMKYFCCQILLLLFFQNLFAQDQNTLTRFEYSEPHMGTEFRILFYAADSAKAGIASRQAFDKIASLEKIMSDYQEDSEVSRLAQKAGDTKTSTPVSDDLWKVLTYAQDVAKRSEGAFDVTAGALTKLWRRAIRQKEFPASEDLDAARKTVGFKDLELSKKQTVKLKKAGMQLDLGGLAKGYAVDEAMAVLRSHGITIALVDGGGDILAGDAPPGAMGWLIEKPTLGKDGLTNVKTPIKNAAIATSGATYKFLEHDGKVYSHILDPRTGLGVTTRQLVIVVAPTCLEADAWATAMSVEVNTDAFLWLKKQGIAVELKLY